MDEVERGGEVAADLALVTEVEARGARVLEVGVDIAQRRNQARRRIRVVNRRTERDETGLAGATMAFP